MNRIVDIVLFIPLILFMATEDFHFSHIMNVSSKEYNFRMGKNRVLSSHWYPRADLKTPSEYVNKVYREGDVIVVGVIGSAYYLDKPFVNYITFESNRFFALSRKGGKEEQWTGRPLVYNLKDFLTLVPTDKKKSLWAIIVLRDFIGGSFEYSKSIYDISERNNMVATLKYTGIDGRIGVLEIRRSASGNNSSMEEDS
jgi:hypothetical protein